MLWSTIILILSLAAFAAIHSFLASLPFKRFLMRVLGPRADELFMPAYSLIAVITILPVIYLLYRYPGPTLYIVPSPWRWLMVGGQLTAALVAPRALLDAPHRFRIRKQLARSGTQEAGKLEIKGIYRWVRDPFLLSGLVIIWLTPFMTVNLLFIYILTSIYLYLGSLHWETRLVAQFGDEYREYRKSVHRIIPWRGRY
ncbi:MAG: isoprenylcysteine carboxylmethyltransferase family protein [Methanosarcinaceae archaeon]|nr:isoprenylcysteine carboxylmethyltransferase family protein [Methanosarcinaceae archaeon]